MRRIWIRRLLPASVVAIVLAFSYFAPALGAIAPGPNQHAFGANCGRFGYGYHGGKHHFPCPNRPFPGHVPQSGSSQAASPAIAVGSSTVLTIAPTRAVAPKAVSHRRGQFRREGFQS